MTFILFDVMRHPNPSSKVNYECKTVCYGLIAFEALVIMKVTMYYYSLHGNIAMGYDECENVDDVIDDVNALCTTRCFANIICLQTCNGRSDEGYCQIRCGDLFENEAVGKFNACAVSKKNCVKQRPVSEKKHLLLIFFFLLLLSSLRENRAARAGVNKDTAVFISGRSDIILLRA